MADETTSKKVQLTQRLREHAFDTSGYHKISAAARRDSQSGRLVSNKTQNSSDRKK
ncbi:MAG: hypothetical protein P9C55_13290 [Defluviicoccus sp.]|nr:hypothetical protein [Defluviicoccus sp.]HRW60975.1 hypothetical protein [Defluviicoccus sp.]